jgi:hypothetical protein
VGQQKPKPKPCQEYFAGEEVSEGAFKLGVVGSIGQEPTCHDIQNGQSENCPQVLRPFDFIDESGVKVEFDSMIQDAVRSLFNKNTGYTIMVPVTINGKNISAVVDTAAQVTVMSKSLCHALGLLKPNSPTTCVRTAETGSAMQCIIVPNISITLGDKQHVHDIVVGDFNDNLILGLDFLIKYQYVIDIPRCVLIEGNNTVECWTQKNSSEGSYFVSQVRTLYGHTVQPYTRILVPVKVSAPPGTLLVTNPVCTSNLLLPSVIIDSGDAVTVIEVVNDSPDAQHLDNGCILTEATEAEVLTADGYAQAPVVSDVRTISSVDKVTNNQVETNIADRLPQHLSDLFADSNSRLNDKQGQQLNSLLCEYADVFSTHKNDLGKFSAIQHKIDTRDEQPTREKLRRTPLKFQGEEEKTLTDMLETGVIQPSTSEWASAPVLVRKKSGEVRYTVDFRKLNAKTRKDSYPLPLISECTDMLAGNIWFHTLDLNAGYWQIEIDPQDRHKTAFLTKFGLFEHVRMAQGLCNAPATFQRVMNLVLQGLIWNRALVYLDDVIILGRNFEEALDNLQEVLERLRKYGLKLKPKKCTLFSKEVVFLGRHISTDGVSVTKDQVKSVVEWPTPRNSQETSKFLGFINYHREFIPGLAGIAQPLYKLVKPKAKFEWTEQCEDAFNRLKKLITSTPVLSFPNAHDTFVLDTDASETAVGAALYQIQEGRHRPIAFSSLTLTPEQRNYCTTRRELLAIVLFTRQFRHYLLGQTFVVRTDHSSLAWLFRFKDLTGQLSRWLEELSQYNMTIQHRSGRNHSNADGLSRIPELLPKCNCYLAGKELSSLPCGGCAYCAKLHNQWAKFQEEVDYVVPLTVRSVTVSESEEENSTFAFVGYSAATLREKQLEDADIAPIINWLESGVLPSENELMLKGYATKALWRDRDLLLMNQCVLYHKWYNIDNSFNLQFVVPLAMREEVLQLHHDHHIGGHLGMQKTLSNIQKSFYWTCMRQDVELYIRTCGICKVNKSSRHPRAPLQHYQAGLPGERVHIDFMGPFPESSSNNRYVMLMVDQFTKWVELAALPNQTASTTASSFFHQWIVRFGTPVYVHTDQGRNFTSELFTEMCELLEISKTRTTPYRPSSNGQVERVNRSVLSFIRCFLEDHIEEWDRFLPALGMTLRSTINRSTGFTPNMLRLGQEVNMPSDLLFGMVGLHQSKPDGAEYVKRLLSRLDSAFKAARLNLSAAHKQMKKDYDKRPKLIDMKFDIGDIVYLVNSSISPGECKKLQPLLKGPYVVKQPLSSHLYKVSNQRGDSVRHHDKLRLCEDRVIPLWTRRLRAKILNLNEEEEEREAPAEEQDMGLEWLFDYSDDGIDSSNGVNSIDEPLDIIQPRFSRRGRKIIPPRRLLD